MPTIQVPALTKIDIDRVFQPFPDSKTWKDGAKRGAIKTKDGTKYQVKETLLKQFHDGELGVDVEVKTFGDKENPGREIVKRVGWNGQAGVPKQNFKQRMDPADALGSFVTLSFQSYVKSGKVPLNQEAIAVALDEIAGGYKRHQSQKSPQRRDDMGDQIPEDDWKNDPDMVRWTNSENPAD